ncbi:hypothetical protein DUNSADRAFT_11817 [Dunaliella salina]|uniref:Uncharacterized protein n=1 Tax=Dunaliella salina TaxID=3046 RepID=A0ABQ7GCH6_DUNSA|nr:hypothetical protein DUNSADRAFT_11817 [Dunaliella salina]|eukprot:KAF5832308.1 hypothetical protein DUNSADRAFT_11817 [Dunaliella salina]
MAMDALTFKNLDDLSEDALALIFCSLSDRLSRKAFFSTCKALRGKAVAAHVHTLKLNVQTLEDAKHQLQCHPTPAVIRRLWLSGHWNKWHMRASQMAASADLLELLSGTCGHSIPTEGSMLKDLEELRLRNCPVTDLDAPFFVAVLRARCPKLTSLAIVNPDIPEGLLKELAESAHSTCSRRLSLQKLELATLSASSEPLQAATIAKMTGLRSLRLYCPVAGKDLGPLSHLCHLRKLELGPEIPPDAKNLGAVLRNCTQLHELGLGSMPEAPGEALVSSSMQRLSISTLPVALVPRLIEMVLPKLQALEIDLLSFVPMEVERNVDSAAELRGGLESFFGPETEDERGALSLEHKERIAQNCAAFAALPIEWSSCAVSTDIGLWATLSQASLWQCSSHTGSASAHMFPCTNYLEVSGSIASTSLHEAIHGMPRLHTLKSWLCGVHDGSAVAACTAAMLSKRSQPLLFKIVTTLLNGPAPSLLQQASAQVQAFADLAAMLPGRTQVTLL